LENRDCILVGYSGHSYVLHNILSAAGKRVVAYCDTQEKAFNPFNLTYLGEETSEKALTAFEDADFVIAVGDNMVRKKIYAELSSLQQLPINAIHPSAIICKTVHFAPNGIMVSAGVVINPLATIGTGAIINTGVVIEHECSIGSFAHIGPGAILCGNVSIGPLSFVGAGAVIRQGIIIGANVMVGAGAVVVKNIPDNTRVMGNPAK
jgi:sugar O-acyltransferase (sialic acid O-acetyltransferase NeuD family)